MQTISPASGTTFAPSTPTANAAGKTLKAVYYTEATGTITMPSGFANKLDTTFGPGRLRVDYKIAAGGETGLSWSWTGSAWRMGCLFCVDNAETSGDPTEGAASGTAASSPNPPNVALAVNASVDDWILLAGADTSASTGNWTAPASWTLEQNFTGDDLGVISIAQAAGGKPAATHANWSGADVTGNTQSVIIAIKSPSGAFDPALFPFPNYQTPPIQQSWVSL